MSETRSNLHQFLKGKQLYSALYGVYTEVVHDLSAVLKQRAEKGETAKITNTEPPSDKEFRDGRRRKQKPLGDADERTKEPATSATGVNYTQLQSKDEVPPLNSLSP
jgi:hypothetical protein